MHDDSSDYGYDMAHEMKAVRHSAALRRPRAPITGLTGRELDLDGGDFGYDQAHES